MGDIANERVHRLLTYIVAADRQGQPLTLDEAQGFDEATRDQWAFAQAFASILNPRPLSPLSWLATTQWVLRSSADRIIPSDLGKAMLRELDERERRSVLEPTRAIVLRGDDPFALSELAQEIGELGPAALMDPYFDVSAWRAIADVTEVRRILTTGGARSKKRIEALRLALDAAPAMEIRVADADKHHERAIIPAEGYWILTNSVNGVGKKLATLAKVPESIEGQLRADFEAEWAGADPLTPKQQPSGAVQMKSADGRPPRRRRARTS